MAKKKTSSKPSTSFSEPPACGIGEFKDKPLLKQRKVKGSVRYYCSKEPFATGWMRIRFMDWEKDWSNLWYPLVSRGGNYYVAKADDRNAFPLFTLNLGYGDKIKVTRGLPKKFGGYRPGDRVDWQDIRTQRVLVSWDSMGLGKNVTEKMEDAWLEIKDAEKKGDDTRKRKAESELRSLQIGAIDRLNKRHGDTIKTFLEKSEHKRKITRIDYAPKGPDFQGTIIFA